MTARDAGERVRTLYCACCGGMMRGRQFHNQDTGYGLGECCAAFVASRWPKREHEGDDWCSIEQTYGVRGYHYTITEETRHD